MTPTVDTIIAAVAAYHRLPVVDLRSLDRARHISWPRQQAYWLIRELTGRSYPEIGAAVGHRDHTTVLYGCREHAKRMIKDVEFLTSTTELLGQLRRVDPWIEAVPFRTRRLGTHITIHREAA